MCCGRTTHAAVPLARNANPNVSAPNVRSSPVRFEYTGKTALTVVSPLTAKKYRFQAPGAILEVDPRDRSWIAFVPHLKRAT